MPEEEVDFPKSIVAEVSEADVAAGLEGFVPAALRGVQAPAATEWEAVGGLEAAKAEPPPPPPPPSPSY